MSRKPNYHRHIVERVCRGVRVSKRRERRLGRRRCQIETSRSEHRKH